MGSQIKVTQIASAIGGTKAQRATLVGLGLNKIRCCRLLEDTPAIRGMIRKIDHLVTFEEVKETKR